MRAFFLAAAKDIPAAQAMIHAPVQGAAGRCVV